MEVGQRSTSGASKLEFAYKTILSRVLNGAYGPGYRLVIDELARELRMSQVPVREAIRRLEAEGWVTFERYVGARVASAGPTEWAQLMEVLAVLEGAAATLAADRLEEEDLRELRNLNQAMSAALRVGNLPAFSQLNRHFHERLVAHCPNSTLLSMTRDVWRRVAVMRRSVFVYVPTRARESVADHERILRLLEGGGPAAELEHAVREDTLRTIHAVTDRAGERGRQVVS
ncbi:MAG: GntR family transcriptional regulator [Candidatus Dormibacteraeota bacterium]|nr:GntR family transcriptional regulator [Candidatus Dormibacteraeota bacterium]